MSDSPIKPKEARKIRAQFRQEEANKRTPQEQLKRLDEAGHRAKKEREKLQAKIKQLVVGESG